MTSNSIYSRFPLVAGASQIRLLELQPDPWSHPLRAKVSLANITDGPKYTTLSYVWGTDAPSHSIILDGSEQSITSNLYAALKYLRSHFGSQKQLLWVDAICINQNDLNEKGLQVGLMAQIYSNCTNVWVHLQVSPIEPAMDHQGENLKTHHFTGDKSDYDGKWDEYMAAFKHDCDSGSPRGLPTITGIEDGKPDMALHLVWFLRLLARGRHFTDIPPLTDQFSADSPYFVALSTMLQALETTPWLSRLWVVQEGVLAPNILVYFGHISLHSSLLVDILQNLKTHTSDGCCLSDREGHYLFRQAIRGFLGQFNQILSLKRQDRSRRELVILGLLLSRREVSVEHDRIYALLGLVGEKISPVGVPDYSLPVANLYTQVSCDFIKRTESLLPLSFTGIRNQDRSLPTWVIDWSSLSSTKGMDARTWQQMVAIFRAGGTSQTQRPVILPKNALEVSAVRLGTLGHVAEPVRSTLSEVINPQRWKAWTTLFSEYLHRHGTYVDGTSMHQVWWRTLCSDCCWGANSARRLRAEDVAFLSRHTMKKMPHLVWSEGEEAGTSNKEFTEPSNPDAHYFDILSMLLTSVADRKLVITENAYIGLVNSETEMTDEIFILPGCDTPLVLRKGGGQAVNSNALESSTYRIVGACFIYGVMDGEVFKQDMPVSLQRIRIV